MVQRREIVIVLAASMMVLFLSLAAVSFVLVIKVNKFTVKFNKGCQPFFEHDKDTTLTSVCQEFLKIFFTLIARVLQKKY